MSTANAPGLLEQYDVAADSKRRISLRGAKWKYFHVKAFEDGSYHLAPRMLVAPDQISAKTLKMLDVSAANFKKGKVSRPIELTPFQD